MAVATRTMKAERQKSVKDNSQREYASEVIENAYRIMEISYNQIASILRVDRKTLFRYRKETSTPSKAVMDRLAKMEMLIELINDAFPSEDAARRWLYRPKKHMQGNRPIDLIIRNRLAKVKNDLAIFATGAHT